MKVLWTHNFNPNIPGAGGFMYTFAKALENIGINVEFLYLGNLKSISQLKLAQEKVRKASKYFDITHAQFGSACALATMRA